MTTKTKNLKRIAAEANEAVRQCEERLNALRITANKASFAFRTEMLLTGKARI